MANKSSLDTIRAANGENFYFARPANWVSRVTLTGGVTSVTLPASLQTLHSRNAVSLSSGGQRFYATLGVAGALNPPDPTLPGANITNGTAPLDSPVNLVADNDAILKLIGPAGTVVTISVWR